MIITFYNRNFVALQNNASLNVGAYKLKRKAVDFDDVSITAEAFTEDVNPCFVVMKTDLGRYYYGAFAGVPEINDDKQTVVKPSDLRTYLNNEILITFGNWYTTVNNVFDVVFAAFGTQVNASSFKITYATSYATASLSPVMRPEAGTSVINVWKFLTAYCEYYNYYIKSEINLSTKTITYTVMPIATTTKSINLWEIGATNFGKWIAPVNEIVAAVKCNNTTSYGGAYILTANNTITNDTALRDLYPKKRKVYFSETDDSTKVTSLLISQTISGVTELVKARFNESLELNAVLYPQFADADFATTFAIYISRGTLYKNLPVGTIAEDEKGAKTITLGYKIDDIVFYIK